MENLVFYLQVWIQERWPHSEDFTRDAYKTEFLSILLSPKLVNE